eukprot:858535-Rhodomonas_salina.2
MEIFFGMCAPQGPVQTMRSEAATNPAEGLFAMLSPRRKEPPEETQQHAYVSADASRFDELDASSQWRSRSERLGTEEDRDEFYGELKAARTKEREGGGGRRRGRRASVTFAKKPEVCLCPCWMLPFVKAMRSTLSFNTAAPAHDAER